MKNAVGGAVFVPPLFLLPAGADRDFTECFLAPPYRAGMNTNTKTKTKPITVWFDGSCPLCRREIRLMRRLDRRGQIDFVDVAGGASDCPLDRDKLLARFHASENGRIVSGAEAFAAMWRAIPILRPLGLLARIPPVLWLLERLYRGFLKIRPAMQRVASRAENPAR